MYGCVWIDLKKIEQQCVERETYCLEKEENDKCRLGCKHSNTTMESDCVPD